MENTMNEDSPSYVPIYKLSTVDNPFNPVTEREQWYNFDTSHGYYCESLVARIAPFSIYNTEHINQMFENAAIDRILRLDSARGLYKKVLIDPSVDEED